MSARVKRAKRAMPRNAAKDSAPPGGKRIGDAEFFLKLEFVEDLLREGKARADIVAACERAYKMPSRTCDDYIARSRVRWEQEAALASVDQRTATLQRIEALLSRLEREKAWAPLISALRLQVDVLGLRAPDRLIVSEAPKDDDLDRMGLVEVVKEQTVAARAMRRAFAYGIATPSTERERVQFGAALRDLATAIDGVQRELRTTKVGA